MSPDDIIEEIERLRASGPEFPVESAVDRNLVTEFRARGLVALRPFIEAATSRDDSRLWEALVAFSDLADVPLLEVIPEPLLVERCLRGLVPGSGPEDRWAVYAVTFGELSDDDRWRIVMRLVEGIPEDDDALWRLGDGPIAALQMSPVHGRRLDVLATTSTRVRRILDLVDELP